MVYKDERREIYGNQFNGDSISKPEKQVNENTLLYKFKRNIFNFIIYFQRDGHCT